MEQNATETVVDETQSDVIEQPAQKTEQQSSQQAKKGSLKEAVKQEVRRFKLKINGKERDVDEKTLIAMAQKGDAADEKFQKSSAKQKQVAKLFEMAHKDPDRFIKEVIGEDAVEYSKKRLARQLEELSLDPKDKELRDLKRKVEQYEEVKKAEAEQKSKEAADKAVEHWTKHYDKVLPEAITAAGLPLTEDVIRHATEIMIANLEEGFDLPMEAVMELTKDRYISSVKRFLGTTDQNKLIELLGQDVAKKLGAVKSGTKVVKKQAVQVDAEERRTVKTEREQMDELQKRLKAWAAQ